MATITKQTGTSALNDSYYNLMRLWQSQTYTTEERLIDYKNLIHTSSALELVLNSRSCITWILDIRNGNYIYVSNNVEGVLGYPLNQFRQEGIAFVKNLMHPEDKTKIWEMTYDAWKCLLNLQAEQQQNFWINRKYRVKKADGTYISLLEQNIVLQTDCNGNIIHLLGTCTDITDITDKDKFVASVHSANDEANNKNTAVNNKPCEQSILSKRECEIVKLISEGYSSKLIADRLFISYNTVNTHRRNIIEKTQTKNTGGLVQFAISNGII